jgi:thioredoxin-related protein
MKSPAKTVEVMANVAIVLVAALLAVVLVKSYLLKPAAAPAANQPKSAVGTKLSVSGVDWSGSKRTLVLALSNDCHYCTESAAFYQRLTREASKRAGARLVAVLPQEIGEGRAYLKKLGVTVDEVRQASLDSIGVAGTPTLFLVDGAGNVTASWVGKLPPAKEDAVLDALIGHDASSD